MTEYKPNTEEAMESYKRYKKHQFKLRWLPFYRQWNKRKSVNEVMRKANK